MVLLSVFSRVVGIHFKCLLCLQRCAYTQLSLWYHGNERKHGDGSRVTGTTIRTVMASWCLPLVLSAIYYLSFLRGSGDTVVVIASQRQPPGCAALSMSILGIISLDLLQACSICSSSPPVLGKNRKGLVSKPLLIRMELGSQPLGTGGSG